jgi:hypothetical protein
MDCVDWGTHRPTPKREESAGRALRAMARSAILSSVEGSKGQSDA